MYRFVYKNNVVQMLEAAGVNGAPGLPAVEHVMEVVATEGGLVREVLTVMEAILTKSSATLKHAPVSEIFLICSYTTSRLCRALLCRSLH